MTYSIVVANGEVMEERFVDNVARVSIKSETYIFLDDVGTLLFSSPIDSTVSVKLIKDWGR